MSGKHTDSGPEAEVRYDQWGNRLGPALVYTPASPPTSGKAVWTLVGGILAIILGGFIWGFIALPLGKKAKREIDESNGRLGGRTLANAGLWCAGTE